MKIAFAAALLLTLVAPAFALCEATAGGRCFYIDPNGDDTNPGTEALPWRTGENIKGTIYTQYRSPGYVQLQPGDIVYFRGGTHTTALNSGGSGGPNAGTQAMIYLRAYTGNTQRPITFKGYPGEIAVLSPSSDSMGIYAEGIKGIVIEDFQIINTTQPCIRFGGTDTTTVRNMTLRFCNTVYAGGNTAGLSIVGSFNNLIEHNTFSDTWTLPSTYRGLGVQLFGGGYTTIRNNNFTNTIRPIINGTQYGYPGCIMYKHASSVANGWTHVINNTFENCHTNGGIGFSTQNLLFSRNLLINSMAPQIADFGGPAYQVNQTYEYNTLIRTNALTMSPSRTPYANLFTLMPDSITYRNNIIYDVGQYGNGRYLYQIGTYSYDPDFDVTVQALRINDNCYYLANTPVFDLFGPAGSYGAKGKYYTLSEWNNTLGYDGRSIFTTTAPFVDAAARDYRLPQGHPCGQMGVYGQAGTPIVLPNDLNGDGQVTFADVVLGAACIESTTPACISLADKNNDNKVNIFDLIIIAANR